MSKFNAKKVVVDRIQFDSKMEGDFYLYLKRLKELGRIRDFTMQPVYELQPSFKKRGLNFQAIKYKADFDVILKNGSLVTIDVKGFETADFKIKKKMFEHKFPQELKLITESKIDGGWIESAPLKVARKIRKAEKEIAKLDKKVTLEYNDLTRIKKLEKDIEKWKEEFAGFTPLDKYFS